jgi:bacterioferritin (cytochrome b1)
MGELVSSHQLTNARLVAERDRIWRDLIMTCNVIGTFKLGIAIQRDPGWRATQERILASEEEHLKEITERLREIEPQLERTARDA